MYIRALLVALALLLSACGRQEVVVGAVPTPAPTPTSSASASAAPTIERSDAERQEIINRATDSLNGVLLENISPESFVWFGDWFSSPGDLGSTTYERSDPQALDKMRRHIESVYYYGATEVQREQALAVGFCANAIYAQMTGNEYSDIANDGYLRIGEYARLWNSVVNAREADAIEVYRLLQAECWSDLELSLTVANETVRIAPAL